MSFEDRVAAVGIATQFQESCNEVFRMVNEETETAKTQIILAREYLKEVKISREQLKYLVLEAVRGGVQGHRAELYTARVAKCLAAIEGREKVTIKCQLNKLHLIKKMAKRRASSNSGFVFVLKHVLECPRYLLPF